MKKTTIISLAMLTLSLTASAASPAKKLIKRMAKIENKGIMIGHQDDPLYGPTGNGSRAGAMCSKPQATGLR